MDNIAIDIPWYKSEYWHRASNNVQQKIELCLTGAASQQTQMPGLQLKKLPTFQNSEAFGKHRLLLLWLIY